MDEQPAILPTEKELPKVSIASRKHFLAKNVFFLPISVVLLVIGILVLSITR